jgi:hypothetical protein
MRDHIEAPVEKRSVSGLVPEGNGTPHSFHGGFRSFGFSIFAYPKR